MMRQRWSAWMLVLGVLLIGAASVHAQLETPLPPLNGVMICESGGGEVLTRYPALGTNQSELTVFAMGKPFCEFTAEDGSSISVPLDVLAANGPTLAVIAYTYPPEFVLTGSTANPSYLYCDQLGGTINFGNTSALGSGWVREDDPADFRTYCVFADGSMIDSFGVFYKSNSTIRGADLTPMFGWTADAAFKDVFGE
jgi:putative hemolysin